MRGINCMMVLAATVCLLAQTPALSAEARLPYQQDTLLKDATYYLDKADATIKGMEKLSASMKPGDASVKIQDAKLAMSYLGSAKQSMGYADTRLKQLPATHSKVKAQLDRVDGLNASIAAAEPKLTEILAGLQKIIDQGGGAAYQADFTRLGEIGRMFNDPLVLERQPEIAMETVKQVASAKAERKRIEEKYAGLLQQNTGESKQLNGTLTHVGELIAAFEKATAQYAAEAPALINAQLDETVASANEAVAKNKPGYFGEHGGLNSALTRAQTRFEVLSSITPDAPDLAKLKEKIQATRATIAQKKESLSQAIVEANTPPDDKYHGQDKAELIALVKTQFEKSGVKGDVLRVGIIGTGWQRSARWASNASGWYKVDISRTQGFVIIKLDEKLGAIYHVNLSKDHLANNQVSASLFENPKDAPDSGQKILLDKIK